MRVRSCSGIRSPFKDGLRVLWAYDPLTASRLKVPCAVRRREHPEAAACRAHLGLTHAAGFPSFQHHGSPRSRPGQPMRRCRQLRMIHRADPSLSSLPSLAGELGPWDGNIAFSLGWPRRETDAVPSHTARLC